MGVVLPFPVGGLAHRQRHPEAALVLRTFAREAAPDLEARIVGASVAAVAVACLLLQLLS